MQRMAPRSLLVCVLALAAGCGARVSDPSVVGGADAPVGTVDADPNHPPSDASGDAAVAPPDARPCTGTPDGEGHCYLFHATPSVTAIEAEAACLADGTHLAIITDATQNTAVQTAIGTTPASFIGATDAIVEGTFKWVDGTTVTFTNFDTGEPNNGNGGHEEDCLVMRGDAGKVGTWDDRPCLPEGVSTPGVYPFVCEF